MRWHQIFKFPVTPKPTKKNYSQNDYAASTIATIHSIPNLGIPFVRNISIFLTKTSMTSYPTILIDSANIASYHQSTEHIKHLLICILSIIKTFNIYQFTQTFSIIYYINCYICKHFWVQWIGWLSFLPILHANSVKSLILTIIYISTTSYITYHSVKPWL